ncbi:MAG TPA: hypothetical protein VK879_12530 [Candidatus Sulfomarinibacteraceae bacterium]|nr:hypothetical protein [Candidatus Sulfomarinibacteraceae bacterium]
MVDDFLDAYMAAGGFPAGAHEDNPHLHPVFVAEIEATVSAFRALGMEANTYDPVLMTALGPQEYGYGFDRLKVGVAAVQEQEATVRVERDWHYTLAVSPLRFTLAWSGEGSQGQWQIVGVSSAGVSENILREATEPERVTERFYEAMIAAAGQFEMPPEWLEHLDPDLVTRDVRVELCDLVWPVGVAIEGSFVQPSPLHLSSNVEEEAYVVVHLPVKGGLLTMHLVRERDSDLWQVRQTICSDSPQGKALGGG